MLTAYFDESGTADSEMLVLAGYVAEAHKWKRFEREWKKILLEFRLPFFHMSECAHFRGPFQGWTESRRKDLLGRLANTVRETAKWSIACSIPLKDYNDIVPEGMRKRLVNPYFLCVWACFPMVIRCCRASKGAGETIDFVFDERSRTAREALGIFRTQKDSPYLTPDERSAFGSLSFHDDRKLSPLQAADFLAYEVSKHRRGRTRKSLLALDTVKGAHEHLDAPKLRQIVSDVRRQLFGSEP